MIELAPATGSVAISPDDVAAYRRDGFVIIPAWYDSEVIARAREQTELISYGQPFAEYLQNPAPPPAVVGEIATGPHGRAEFPTGNLAIDALVDDRLVQGLNTLTGAENFYLHSHLFPRAGNTDKRHPAHPWQGYHIDHDTYSFLPHSEDHAFSAITAAVFMTDVDRGCAPLHVIPGSHRRSAALSARLLASESGNFDDIRDFPELAAPIPALGGAGSILFYSTYLVHAAVPFLNKKAQRLIISVTATGSDHARWTNFTSPNRYEQRSHFRPLWERGSPQLRSFFGWPPPGHPYYTPTTLRSLAKQFPRMDLTPYASAMAAR